MPSSSCAIAFASLLSLALAVQAEPVPEPAPGPASRLLGHLATSDSLTGDWGGYRTRLEEEQKLSVSATYYGESMHVLGGGNATRRNGDPEAHPYDGALDLRLKWEPVDGTEFFAQAYDYAGRGPATTGASGSYQYLSNWENSANYFTLYSLWIKQKFGDHLWLQLGKFDPLCTMACDAYGEQAPTCIDFVCPSFIWTPNLPYGTYPYTPWNAMAGWSFSEDLELKAIASYNRTDSTTFFGANLRDREDDASEGDYGITSGLQLDWRFRLVDGLKTTLRPGIWHDSSRIAWVDDDGNSTAGAWGGYLGLEQELFRQEVEGAVRSVSAFALVSVHEPDRTRAAAPLGACWSAGLVAAGLVPSRPDDRLGIGLSQVRFSDDTTPETVTEAYYHCQLLPWAYAKPVLQYVDHPAGADSNHTWVAGLQFGITF